MILMVRFRPFQMFVVSMPLVLWLVRFATHPGLHPMMLLMAAALFISTEVSYRAGLRARQKSPR
jgi:hypothetical protein